MKLLLVEQCSILTKDLQDILSSSYSIYAVSDTQTTLSLAVSGVYDVILIDVGDAESNICNVCEQLRSAQVTTPILLLSNSLRPETRAKLIEQGADDVLEKPFHERELAARLSALLRRGHFDPEATQFLKTFTLKLDPDKREVVRSGKRLTLRRKEFDILEYLIRNQGKVVTRNMILNNVWDNDTNSWNNTVTVHIKSLRDKVDRPFKRPLIKTVYGFGYTIDRGAISDELE